MARISIEVSDEFKKKLKLHCVKMDKTEKDYIINLIKEDMKGGKK